MTYFFKQDKKSSGHLYLFYLLTISAFIMLLMGFVPVTAQENQQIDDQKIIWAIQDALAREDAVSAFLIDVSCTDGIVTLSGTTDNMLSRDKATEVAASIKGVKSVINNITITPLVRSDQEIKYDVEQALLQDAATELYEVDVSVDNKIVRLKGTVQSWQEKQLVGQVAKSVRGVKGIVNEIDIRYPEKRTDLEIEEEVRKRLASDVWVDELLVDVTVQDGNVFLTGTVGSARERQWAVADAWVVGVKNVDASGLEVQWWAKDDMKKDRQFPLLSDQEIENAILDALVYDPRVSAFNVQARVENGVATLYGTVDNIKAKISAAEDASNTRGVIRVKNRIRVRPETKVESENLEQKVRETLIRDPYIDLYDIAVTVFNGRIFLDGEVNSIFERQHAEDVVWRIEGVVNVVNNIDYVPLTMTKSDWELKQDVKDQLFWDPYVDRSEVFMQVEDGEVILTGEVDTWRERVHAEDAAYNAGAVDVINKIEVKGFPNFKLDNLDTIR
ncbi:MAG: BON domain-containing protein [Calditrichaeota bacterium]|nr:BON domain-containing protein [Calditrichota bacterium]RQV99103.1 MAG: BON domain-containing protein [Calditrichota bacterium]